MSEYFKQIVVRVLLGVPSYIVSMGIIGAIHGWGYYPEDAVTAAIMTAPSIFAIETVRWTFLLVLTIVVWWIADFFWYRRGFPRLRARVANTVSFLGRSTQQAADSKDAIVWDGGYLLRARTTEWGVEFYGFQLTGRNNTDRFINKVGGHVRSEKNGRSFPILLQHHDKLVPPDGYGIPARHQFHIGAEFIQQGGVSGPKFLSEYGILTFVFEYDGSTFTKVYTFEEIAAEVAKAEEFLKPKPVNSEVGFKKINETSQPAIADVRHRLALLRSDGVAMRNAAQNFLDSSGWVLDTRGWMDLVIETIRQVNPADAEWFATLDAVPPARVSHNPGASPSLAKAFREHDFRLVKLEQLIKRYHSTRRGWIRR